MLENTESQEMYLTTIYALQKKNGMVRSVDVADERGYSKVSVHILLIRGVSRISRNITTFLKAKKSLEGKGIRIYDCEYGGFLDAVISEVRL